MVIPDDRNSTYAHIIDEVALKDPQIIMVALKNINAEKYDDDDDDGGGSWKKAYSLSHSFLPFTFVCYFP